MSRKLLIITVILIIAIFSHYYNKHKLIHYAREHTQLIEEYNALKAINTKLLTDNNRLSSRTRIQKLAVEELDMFFPKDNSHVHNILIDHRKKTFCLIDYFVPAAEAITRK